MDYGAESYCRYLDGDNDGLKEIVETHFDGLMLYLNLFVRNLSEAEELAEETLFQLVSKRPVFSGKSNFRTWLYAIGRNVTLRYIRRREREAELLEEYDTVTTIEEDAERELLTKERDRSLYRAMGELKKDYRQVLWLRYFEKMDEKSIATIMKKSVHSIEHLHRRAKEALREELRKEGFSYEES